jgi:hypothetical protein
MIDEYTQRRQFLRAEQDYLNPPDEDEPITVWINARIPVFHDPCKSIEEEIEEQIKDGTLGIRDLEDIEVTGVE